MGLANLWILTRIGWHSYSPSELEKKATEWGVRESFLIWGKNDANASIYCQTMHLEKHYKLLVVELGN